MSPSTMLKFSKAMYTDEDLALKYGKNRAKGGPVNAKYADGCNVQCRKHILCETSSSDYKEYKECMSDDFINLGDPLSALLIYLTYPWFGQE